MTFNAFETGANSQQEFLEVWSLAGEPLVVTLGHNDYGTRTRDSLVAEHALSGRAFWTGNTEVQEIRHAPKAYTYGLR